MDILAVTTQKYESLPQNMTNVLLIFEIYYYQRCCCFFFFLFFAATTNPSSSIGSALLIATIAIPFCDKLRFC